MLSYMIEYERMTMTHMLASQEFFIAQYQENLYRLYLESAAQFSQLPQTQECSGQISALQESISHQDTMRELVRPLDLSKDSKTKSLEIKEGHARPIAIAHKGKTYSRQELGCPFCGKMFSRPWLLKGKFKSSSFEDIYKNLYFKVTCEHTQERSRMGALTAAKVLQIRVILRRIFRLIPIPSHSNVETVENDLPLSHTYINMEIPVVEWIFNPLSNSIFEMDAKTQPKL